MLISRFGFTEISFW